MHLRQDNNKSEYQRAYAADTYIVYTHELQPKSWRWLAISMSMSISMWHWRVMGDVVYGYRGRAMGNGWLISSMSMSIFDFNIMLIGDALFIYFFIPFTIFALLALAPLPIVVTQIRDHIADSCPPPPLRFVPSIFIATRPVSYTHLTLPTKA